MEDAMKGSEFTIARYYALQAVKQQWKDRGKCLPDFGELHREARDYLDNHPELIELLPQSCCKWSIATPEKTKAVQHLRDLHDKGSADLQGLSLCKCHDRNAGLK
jgi:hypothetical protein